jgi:hypothetical protein
MKRNCQNDESLYTLSQTMAVNSYMLNKLKIATTSAEPYIRLSVHRCQGFLLLSTTQLSYLKKSLVEAGLKHQSPILNQQQERQGDVYLYEDAANPFMVRLVIGRHARRWYPNSAVTTMHITPLDSASAVIMDSVLRQIPSSQILISQVEYAMDFHGLEPDALCAILRKHLLLKWRHKKDRLDLEFDDTDYINNVRRSRSRGVKFYKKLGPDGEEFVRLEMTRKSVFFNQRRIKSLFHAMAMRPIDAFKGLEFKFLDISAFERRLLREVKKGQMTPHQAKRQLGLVKHIAATQRINDAKDAIRGGVGWIDIKRHPLQDALEVFLKGMAFSNRILWRTDDNGNHIPVVWEGQLYVPPADR